MSFFSLPKELHLDLIYTPNIFLSQLFLHIRQFLCALTSIEKLPEVLSLTVVLWPKFCLLGFGNYVFKSRWKSYENSIQMSY